MEEDSSHHSKSPQTDILQEIPSKAAITFAPTED